MIIALLGECLTRLRGEAGDALNQTVNVKKWSDLRLIVEVVSVHT